MRAKVHLHAGCPVMPIFPRLTAVSLPLGSYGIGPVHYVDIAMDQLKELHHDHIARVWMGLKLVTMSLVIEPRDHRTPIPCTARGKVKG